MPSPLEILEDYFQRRALSSFEEEPPVPVPPPDHPNADILGSDSPISVSPAAPAASVIISRRIAGFRVNVMPEQPDGSHVVMVKASIPQQAILRRMFDAGMQLPGFGWDRMLLELITGIRDEAGFDRLRAWLVFLKALLNGDAPEPPPGTGWDVRRWVDRQEGLRTSAFIKAGEIR